MGSHYPLFHCPLNCSAFILSSYPQTEQCLEEGSRVLICNARCCKLHGSLREQMTLYLMKSEISIHASVVFFFYSPKCPVSDVSEYL